MTFPWTAPRHPLASAPATSPAAFARRCATRLAGLALLAAACLLAAPGARAASDPATAEALMRASGIWAQLDKIAPQVREGVATALAQERRVVDPAVRARINAKADAAYGGAALRAAVRAYFAEKLDAAQVGAITQWLASPAARTLIQAEDASAARTVEPMVRLQEGTQLLATLPAARVALLERYVRLIRAPEAMANVTVHLATATNVGVALADPDVRVIDVEGLRDALEEQRPRMLQTFPRIVMALFAKSYEQVADADLTKAVAFLGTPAGRHFTDVTLRALDTTLADAAVDWADAVVNGR